jgi:2-phosphosulfolactate phosphatase
VIIDVFRATSTIAAALHNGASRVIPVATVAECVELGLQIPGSITAGERDGKIAEGLAHGNSPSEYPRQFVENKTLVLTTTNGTRLLHMVRDAAAIITGAFLNLGAICDYLAGQSANVLLACSAWKDRFNLEDTLFAGAVAARLQEHYDINCDSTRAACYLYERSGGTDLISFLRDSSHYKRLAAYGLEADMEYCATPDLHPVLPILRGNELLVL